MNIITIFTPTYNRAYILPQLYNSLLKQTNTNFEWLVIDDGSTDNTKQLINNWREENKITIRYYYQENSGVSQAWNNAIKVAHSNFFTRVDSDDYLKCNSIELLITQCNKIKDKKNIDSVISLTEDKTENIIGDKYPYNEFLSNNIFNFFDLKIKGEKCVVTKTQILQNHPFPKFDSEKFVPEAWLWFQLGEKYQQLYFNEVTKCYDNTNTDSITSQIKKIKKQNPLGFMNYYLLAGQLKSISLFKRFQYLSMMHKTRLQSKKNIVYSKNLLSELAKITGFMLYLINYK